MEELRNLCSDLARRSGGIVVEEFARAMLTSLGYGRAAADIAQDALVRVQYLVERGWLKVSNGHVTG
jgi:hypothetical protein